MSTHGADLAMPNINRSNKSKKKESAFSLFARGYSHPEIANEIKVSTRTLSRWRGDYEIQINSRPAIKPKSDAEIAAIAQSRTSERIDDLRDLAFDYLESILTDEQTKVVDRLRCISIIGEWGRMGKSILVDQKTECEFPFPMEGGEQSLEVKDLSDDELRKVYFESLRET
ncbi:MAG: hypothetical protein ACYTXY_01150 [Nostoc sp.]